MSESDEAPTAGADYAQRLQRLSDARWKQVLHVQAPFRANLRSFRLGRTLDVGCGTGRNLAHLDEDSVGVDHNPHSVLVARESGRTAVTSDDFFADTTLSAPGIFDSLLCAHVVEHMTFEKNREVLTSYLPSIRPNGKVVFITPQERGYASDSTHVAFSDFNTLARLAGELGLNVVRRYSFPFPRFVGKIFTYNEFVLLARTPSAVA